MYILAILPSKTEKNVSNLQFKCLDDLEMKPQGKPPTGRYDHAVVKIRNYVAIIGGRRLASETKNQMFDDSIYLLQLDNLVWTRLKTLAPAVRIMPGKQLFRSDFMYAVVDSALAPPTASVMLSKQE